MPDDVEVHALAAPVALVDLMVEAGLAESKGEARKLIRQGAVGLDGTKVLDELTRLEPSATERVLKVGKRRFLKLAAQA